MACIPRVPVPPTMSTKPSAPKEKYERGGFWHDVFLDTNSRQMVFILCCNDPSPPGEFGKVRDRPLIGNNV